MQNHAKYKESKARSDCYPIVTIKDMEGVFNDTQKTNMEKYVKDSGKTSADIIANPCGLVAKTFFNG